MKLLATIVLLASCLGAFAQLDPRATNTNPSEVWITNMWVEASPGLRLVNLTTNRYTNYPNATPVRVEPILSVCPECGGPNHHERRVENAEIYEVVRATLVSGNPPQTNTAAIFTSPRVMAVVTNVVLRLQPRRQPGWTNAPVPPITP